MNERVTALRERALRSRRVEDEENEALRRASLAQTADEPEVMGEAKACAHVFRNRQIPIHDGELIVGTRSCLEYSPGEATTPEIAGRARFVVRWPVSKTAEAFFREGMLSGAGNHTTMDYQAILDHGFTGLLKRIDARIARLSPAEPDGDEKRDFLAALRIVGEGYIDFCRRYADHALSLSQETKDEARRLELETIARNCRRAPAEPPTNFWEACQALWLCFFFLPDAPGRVDQYLYPYYRQDMEQGTLTHDFARELVSCLWIKYFEFAGAQAGVSAIQHLTLGGVNPDGNDASNVLTRLCLDVTEDLKLSRPQVGLRWHRHTPSDLLKRAVRVLRNGTGNPDFCSDEQIVPALIRTGVQPEDARDFSLSGCHEVVVTGKAQMGSVEGFINLPKILRLTLGLEPALHTGADLDVLESFEQFWAVLEEAMALVAEQAHQASVVRDRQEAALPGGNLAASLVVNDCIEEACGYTRGGARYNHCNWDIIGIANLADALVAIHRLVFEEQALTLPDFAVVLRADWQDREDMRRQILNRLPHFGNDQDEVDRMARRIIETFSAIIKRHTPFRGGEYILGTTAGAENMHVEFGRVTGATPDGRKAGEPLADSLGAAQGRDRHGVTALLNSVAKLPHALLPTATTLNVKLEPQLVRDEAGIEKIAALIQGHFLEGGQQCQFSLVNREMLLEAKRHPDRHADLMVRVTGYSARFTALWEDLQDEIIARTEHGL